MESRSPIRIPVDFFVSGVFEKDDHVMLEGIHSGSVENRYLSKEDAVDWLSTNTVLTEKFVIAFLQLLKHTIETVAIITPEVLQVLMPSTTTDPETNAAIWIKARRYVEHYGKRRFLVTMLHHNDQWFWFIADSLHMSAYWGDTLHDDAFRCPDEFKWFLYQYTILRQEVFGTAMSSTYTYTRVSSPQQYPGDEVHSAALAAACIVAFFLRGEPSPEPIRTFSPSDALFIRERMVLSFAKNTFLLRVIPIIKNKSDSPAKRIRVESPQAPTVIALPTDFFLSAPVMSFCPEYHIYSPAVRLVDCRLKPDVKIPSFEHMVVLSVAILSSEDKSKPSTVELRNFLQKHWNISHAKYCQLMSSFKFLPDSVGKTPKATRPLRKQKSTKGKHWVLTKAGFDTYITPDLCTYTKMHYQQGRKSIKENKLLPPPTTVTKAALIHEVAPLLNEQGLTHMDIVHNQLSRVRRPLSLTQIVKSIVHHGALSTLNNIPESKVRSIVATKIRQAVNTGSTQKAKRNPLFNQFRVAARSKKAKKRRDKKLYIYLIGQEDGMHQIRENSTELVAWKQFGTDMPPHRFLYVSTVSQRKLFTLNEKGQIVPTERLYIYTMLELPEQHNHWTLLTAPLGGDITTTSVHDKIYGCVMRQIEANEPFTVQLTH